MPNSTYKFRPFSWTETTFAHSPGQKQPASNPLFIDKIPERFGGSCFLNLLRFPPKLLHLFYANFSLRFHSNLQTPRMAQTLSAVRFLHSFLIKKRTTKWRKHRTPKRKLDISTSFAHAHNRPFIHNLWRKFRSVLEVNDFQPFSVFLLNFHNYSLSPPNFTHGRNTIVLTMLSVYGLFLFDSTVQFRNPQN